MMGLEGDPLGRKFLGLPVSVVGVMVGVVGIVGAVVGVGTKVVTPVVVGTSSRSS